MIKLFVAEDQVLILQDICRKIEKTGRNAEIIGTALNGQDAYKKILDSRPDILITDIRMPIQSGLELIRRLKEGNFPVKTVILSGYKDFEYAKEAIQLGVDEYLLKPVSTLDLTYVLDTLEEKILSEQNSSLQRTLFEALTTGAPISQEIASSLSFVSCYLMLVNLDSCATFSFQDQLPFENELDELLKSSVVHKYLKRGETVYIYNGQTYNQKLLIFFLHKTTADKLDMMASELQKWLKELTDSSTICISKPFHSLDSLAGEYMLLTTQLTNQLIFAGSSILYSKDFLEGIHAPAAVSDDTFPEAFYFSVRSRNHKDFLTHLHDFLMLCKENNATQKQLSSYLKRMLDTCFDDIYRKQLTGKELEIDEYLSNARTYEELESSLKLMFEQLFFKNVKSASSLSNPEELVEKVKKYIRSNYGKDININDIAVHFSITPTYLSRLFKKYSDVRPIEYLTNYRIQQACDYFAHSQLTVREVSELCGYSNQFYFSKAFKQITSLSPSEYRIQHQVKPE